MNADGYLSPEELKKRTKRMYGHMLGSGMSQRFMASREGDEHYVKHMSIHMSLLTLRQCSRDNPKHQEAYNTYVENETGFKLIKFYFDYHIIGLMYNS